MTTFGTNGNVYAITHIICICETSGCSVSYEMNLPPTRELFHGRHWLEDPCFFSPMVDTSCGHVFVNDFVIFQRGDELEQGRVSCFLQQVKNFEYV